MRICSAENIDSSKYFSNENIMQDIPILEIDCNMEFHDNQEIKDKMLDQVWPNLTLIDLMLIFV